jgi:hypothetical protein
MNLLDRILPWRRAAIRERAEAVAAVLMYDRPTEEELVRAFIDEGLEGMRELKAKGRKPQYSEL